MRKKNKITILGGGPAGLASAYYLRKNGYDFQLFEKQEKAGGNAITTQLNGYSWDSGAHRFHDKFNDITADVKSLLGNDLHEVNAPSFIFYKNRFLHFPLRATEVFFRLGIYGSLKAFTEIIATKLFLKPAKKYSLADFALSNYGRTLAKPFLLDYSEKLWGKPADELSSAVSGTRLNGLKLRQLIKEKLFGSKKVQHLEGKFFYPEKGIGQLMNALAENAGIEKLHFSSAVTAIHHNNNSITQIQINNAEIIDTEQIVNTLPLPLVVKLLKPAPPAEIQKAAEKLQFRQLLLVVFFIERPQITKAASVYFPGKEIFTRVVEPKNRSAYMAPPKNTSLVAEIPCFCTDEIWQAADNEIIARAKADILKTGLVAEHEITDALVQRISNAYPVITLQAEEALQTLNSYFSRFTNMHLLGRNSTFTYTHIHDIMRWAKALPRQII